VIQPSSARDSVMNLMRRSDVEKLDWDEIDTLERATPVVDQWHVFYFERPVTNDEKLRFDHEVAGFFERSSGRPGTASRNQQLGRYSMTTLSGAHSSWREHP
jgi:hypothetical protein